MKNKIYELTPISELPKEFGAFICIWHKANKCYYIFFDGEWNFDPDMRTPDGWLKLIKP